jgi:DNA-binding GntR family transcriptional regulator
LQIIDLLLKGDIVAATQMMSEHMRLAKQQAIRGYFGSGEVQGATEGGTD